MRSALVLVAILLAGCADDAPPAPRPIREPTIPPTVEVLRPAEQYDATLASGPYALEPPEWHASLPLTIPNGTTRVRVEIIFGSGAASNFQMRLAGCSFDAPAAPGDGRNITQDCGGLYPGSETLELLSGAGLLHGSVNVIGTVCVAGPYSCPRAPP